MELSRDDIYRIIIEEYIREEGLLENQRAEDLLRQIMGDKKYCEEYPERCRPPEDGRGGDTASMPKPKKKPTPLAAAPTMPLPADDASVALPVQDQIVGLLAQLEPEEAIKIINNIVLQNFPQYMPAAPDEQGPDPDRPVILSPGDPRRNAIREAILKILSEYKIAEQASIYHDSTGGDDSLITDDDLDILSDKDLLDIAEKNGIDIHRYTFNHEPELPLADEERARIIGAIKNA
jgi:hypothetical protein